MPLSLVARMWAWALLLASACAHPAPESQIELQIIVQDDTGTALSGVPISIDGAQVTLSDRQGRARALVHGSAAGRVHVSARCPTTHRPSAPRAVPLGAQAKALTLELLCKPSQRTLAVVVRAPGGEGAVVRADGEPVGRIDAEGVLHALLSRPPDSAVRLTIDTSEHPRLLPQHPVREVQVADRDEIVVFDQPFTLAQAKPPPAKRKPKSTLPVPLPYAIGRGPR